MSPMAVLLTIGDFSRMTYLSVKALRHYHEIGLLEPADVDPDTGYRLYQASQVPTAQVIRRFRDLGMGLDTVKAVLNAPDIASRNAGIAEHLQRMEQQLEQTQSTVASLRILLEQTPVPIKVEFRSIPSVRALGLRDRVGMDGAGQWWSEAFAELQAALDESGVERAGPDGALYSADFFQADSGEATAFIPVAGDAGPFDRVQMIEVPAAEVAVALHHGTFGDLDTTYGALGTFVAERAIGVEGPIREYYLTGGDRIEVCWPIFQTAASGGR